jgi:hypothetical protein
VADPVLEGDRSHGWCSLSSILPADFVACGNLPSKKSESDVK